jgi:rhamnulokinase
VTGPAAYAAVDLGAESGRVMLGRLTAGRVALELVHRFPNRPVRLPDGLHWNVPGLFAQVLDSLKRVQTPLLGVGVDAWGVDYGLLDGDGRLLGLPFHHRDGRTRGMVERIHTRVSRTELYSATGIQTMPINTLFQLAADERSPALAAARRIALIPDLLAFWLSGQLANEVTAASTTGLVDARTGTWARELIDRLGLPAAPFTADPVDSGTRLGPLLAHHPGGGAPVHAVAGHDTASAFAAAPVRGRGAAVLSSGTWSLLGVELDQPVLTADAAACNLTNERGVDGTIRLLRNVMGLWLVQECRSAWDTDYDELHRLAEEASGDVALFDPDDEALLAPGNMPARIAAVCTASGQAAPAGPGEMVRSILVSLGCKYRLVLERLTRVTGREIEVVHVVGGGARNRLLCALTADLTGRPVIAGPAEATALGNVLVQARACGELGSLDELRAVAAASAQPDVFEPTDRRDEAEATYRRFLELTGQRELALT